MEEIKKFYIELSKDEKFKVKLEDFIKKNGNDYEMIIEKLVLPQARKMGYDFTKESLLAYEKGNTSKGLSDEELLNVAGGFGQRQIAAFSLGAILAISGAVGIANNFFGGQSADAPSKSVAAIDLDGSDDQMSEIETQEKTFEGKGQTRFGTGGGSIVVFKAEDTQAEPNITLKEEESKENLTEAKENIEDNTNKKNKQSEEILSQVTKEDDEESVEMQEPEVTDEEVEDVKTEKEIRLDVLRKQIESLVKSTKKDDDELHQKFKGYEKQALDVLDKEVHAVLRNEDIPQDLLDNLTTTEEEVQTTITELEKTIGELEKAISRFDNKELKNKERKALVFFKGELEGLKYRLRNTKGLKGSIELYKKRVQEVISEKE